MKGDPFRFAFTPLGDLGWVSFEIHKFSERLAGLRFDTPAECKAWLDRRFKRSRRRVRWTEEMSGRIAGVIEFR
jgi:hypothetical protein